MKPVKAQQVGQIIDAMIDAAGARDAYDAQHVCYLWPEVVGPMINRYTIRRYVSNRVLYVELTSAPLKSELQMMRHTLVQRLNEAVGHEVINDIVIR